MTLVLINCINYKLLEDIITLVKMHFPHFPLIMCTNKESKLKAKPWINTTIQK